MGQTVKLRRSAVAGKKPLNSQLELGELSVNTTDGKVFLAKSGSQGPSVEELIITNTQNTGSIDLIGSISASFFTGSFVGDGRSLYNIPASGVTGLSLDQIANGSSTASIDNDGLQVNTDTSITGSLTATEFTGSGLGLTNVPFYISGSDVNGSTYGKTFTKLQFDDNTGLNVSESSPGTAFISIGSHYRDIFVNGSEILRATGSDSLEIVAAGGLEISTSLSDTNGNGYTKELKFDITNFSSSIKDQFDIITGSLSASGEGRTARLEVTGATSTWTFDHNLNEQYPSITVFDSDGNVIIPQNIEAISSTQLVVSFASPQTGVVTATVGGGLPTLGNEGSVLVVSGSTSGWKDGILSSSLFTMPTATGSYGVEVLTDNVDGTTTFEVPKTIYEYVKNTSGGFLPKGTPVHVTGVTGFNSEVIAADAGDPSKMPATYILNQDLQDQEEGLGIAMGHIQGIDTNGFTAGEPVYVAVGGGWTQSPPTGSALIQNLGILTKIGDNGGGVVLGAGRSNAVPNLLNGQIFYGEGNVAKQIPLSDVITGSNFAYTGSFTGSFKGDGSQLYNIPASGVTGLSLDKIANGSATASISPTGLVSNVGLNITGSIVISGTVDGVDVSSLKTSYDTTTGSFDGRLDSLETESGSIRSTFNTYTSSNDITNTTQNDRLTSLENKSGSIEGDISTIDGRLDSIETESGSIRSAFNTYTSSNNSTNTTQNNRLNSLETTSGSLTNRINSLETTSGSHGSRLNALETESGSIRIELNTYTSSNNTTNTTQNNRLSALETESGSIRSDFNTVTSSFDGRLDSLETESGSIRTTFNSYTSSNNTTNTTQNNRLTALESATSSLSGNISTIDGRVDSLETESGSIRSAFNTYTSSNNTTNTSQNNRLTALETESGSIRTDFNVITGSFDGRLDSLETESGSIRTVFNSYTSSNNTTNTTQNNRLSALEIASGSIRSDFNTITSSFDGRLDSLETTSGSHNTRIGDLESFETTVNAGLEFTGSNVTVKGNLLVKGTETRVNATTVEISDNIISLNGSGAANAGIEVRDATAPGLLSGSLIWDGTNNYWKGGTKSSEQRLLTVLDTGSLVDRLDSLETTTGSLDGRVDSLETFSGSADSRLDSIESVTGSYITGYTETDTLATVTSRGASTSTAVEFTGGLTTYHTNLNFGVMPDYQQEGTIKITRTDGTDRSHLMKFYNDGTAGNNYIKFALHNGTVSSTTDVLSLFGDGAVNIGGVFQFSTTSDLFQINNNTNTGGLNLSGNNSRIYFGGNRAIEGAQDGSNLTLGEGYSTIYLSGNGEVLGTLNTTGNITATSNQPNIYLKESDTQTHGRIVQSGGVLYLQSSASGYTGAGEITFGSHGHTTEYGRFSTSGDLKITRDFIGQGLYINSGGSAVSGTQVAIVQDGNQNLQRWGSATTGADSYRFRIDQTFKFIANDGIVDNLTIDSSDGSITAKTIIKSGGTSSQFLMADGSVSTNPGWLTSYTETDTLQTVTSRGAITTEKVYFRYNTTADPLSAVEINGGGNHTGLYINPNASKQAHVRFGTADTLKWQIRVPFQDGDDSDLKIYSWVGAADQFLFSHGGNFTATGTLYASGGNSSDWNTAYGWGDHDGLYLPIGGGTLTGNLTVGATNRTSDTVVQSLADQGYKAGFEAYGNGQGTGYLYVGQSSEYGGGISYNGDGSPAFVNGETADYITFYRREAGTNTEVFAFPYSNNNVYFNGEVHAGGGNSAQWNTAVTWGDHDGLYLPIGGGTLTGGLIHTTDDYLMIRSSTNGNSAGIRFSDHQSGSYTQYADIVYRHVDTASYGSGNSFEVVGTESTMTFLVRGKVMYTEGIYTAPATGTGAGTRKDTNWDTAYGWGNHANGGYASSGYLTNTSGAKLEIQNAQDGGSSKGIYMWTTTDTNWGIYMSQAGASKSLADGTAAAGLDGRTSHAIRFRVADSTDQIGFLWENSSETALMQLQPNTGNLYVAGTLSASGYNKSNWDTAYGWGDHAGRYMTQGLTLTGINTITNGGNRYDPSTSNPTNEHYAVLTYGNGGNVTGQLATHFVTGNLYSRGYNSSWSAWRRYWNSTDFSSTNVSNWNTAYGWGNHSGLYLGISATAADSNKLNGISSTQIFNNMGQNHSTQTDFNNITNFGFRYVQGSTNGPGTGSSQFYGFSIGLGNDYAFSQYALQLAIPRYIASDKYLSFRTRENTTWGSWSKIYAGYADTAGTAGNITSYTINQNLGTGNQPTFSGVNLTDRLYLNGGSYEGSILFGSNSVWRCGIRQHDDADAELRIWTVNNNGMIFLANGYNGEPANISRPTDGLVVGPGNNVGIGNFSSSDPGYKLQVNGTVGVGGHLTPTANSSYNLGSTSLAWANIYTNDLHLSNMNKEDGNEVDGTKGDWTIQEGQENLYIINNNNGKKYRIKLEEI